MQTCEECRQVFPNRMALLGHLKTHRRAVEISKARIIEEENAKLRARLAKYEPESMGPAVDAEVEDD